MKVITTTKQQFALPTKDFKNVDYRDLTVSIVEFDGTLQFEVTVPKYILDEAKALKPDKYGDLKTFLRSPVLNGIQHEMADISNDLVTHHTFVDEVGKKVIFIRFSGQTRSSRESTYGAGMGKTNNIVFQFFTGYHFVGKKKKFFSDEEVEYEKFTNYYKCSDSPSGFDHNAKWREQELKPLHHTDTDRENLKRTYLIVDWTEEREKYLTGLQQGFINLTDKLNEYLKDLTAENLDQLILEAPFMKLLPASAQ